MPLRADVELDATSRRVRIGQHKMRNSFFKFFLKDEKKSMENEYAEQNQDPYKRKKKQKNPRSKA